MEIQNFDKLFSTNNIQIMKVLFSTLPPNLQKLVAIYIKYQELHYTIAFFDSLKIPCDNPSRYSKTSEYLLTLQEQILPFCDSHQKQQLQSLSASLEQMDNIKEMFEMFQMFQSMMPEGGDIDDFSELFKMNHIL